MTLKKFIFSGKACCEIRASIPNVIYDNHHSLIQLKGADVLEKSREKQVTSLIIVELIISSERENLMFDIHTKKCP